MLDFISSLDEKAQNNLNFVLCDDFNAHTSDLPDFVVDDNITNSIVLRDDYVSDTSLNRVFQDNVSLNSNDTLLLDLCKQTGFCILNGRVCGDKDIGRYTYVSPKCSNVDYVITSQNIIKKNVDSFFIHDPNLSSDHCLELLILLKFDNNVTGNHTENNNYGHFTHIHLWDKNKDSLSSQIVLHSLIIHV